MSEIIKWWKNKYAVIIVCIGVLAVVIGFLFAYFISWGWILSFISAIIGGVSIRYFINKLIDDWAQRYNNTDSI